jgi:hypothetical protein
MRFVAICWVVWVSSVVAAEAPLPAAWHGDWAGTLTIRPTNGKEVTVPMELSIKPTADAGALTWQIVYGAGERKQVRDYEIKAGAKAGQLVIDEKNGVLIPARLSKQTLHSQFKVQGNLIYARYELREGALHFEITTFDANQPIVNKVNNTEIAVEAFTITNTQSAELKPRK